jgi:hypothetical protein
MFGCLAQVIPPDVEGALRPGCIFFSVDLWYSNAEDAGATQAALQRNFLRVTSGDFHAVRPFWTIADTDVLLPGSEHQASAECRALPFPTQSGLFSSGELLCSRDLVPMVLKP